MPAQSFRNAALLSALLLTGGLIAAAVARPARAIDAPHPVYLTPSQKWNEADRDTFYFTSQGSDLMPYDWFLSLESAENHTLFQHDLARFGFLPAPHTAKHPNPDALPLGFVENKDTESYQGLAAKRWVGFTCAACHTGAFQYKAHPGDAAATTVYVEGAPGHVDFGRFVDEIAPAVAATASDPVKFSRFADRVLGSDRNRRHRASLRVDFNLFAAQFARFARSRQTATEWGPGRVDAFGMIFNRVCALSLNKPENLRPTDAPVNYPFLWNIPRQDNIQWHGETPNKNLLDKIGRNTGEALGVFARIDLDPSRAAYRSSVSRTGLLWLEKEVGKLGAPAWPEAILGSIDRQAARRGHALYAPLCGSCHAALPADPRQRVHIVPTPLNEVQTDPATTMNFHTREARTGPLEGHLEKVFFPLGLKRFGSTAPDRDLVQNAVIGSVFYPRFFKLNGRPSPKDARSGADAPLTATSAEAAATYASASVDLNKIGYEARPLNGIWATAPYLHNGSVPSLWQLLLPPDRRVKTFYIGGWRYDPVNIGYQTEADPESRLFDTALPGNHNSGHNYGANLTDAQRRDLLEYLKTL